jgi:hypothetical protein
MKNRVASTLALVGLLAVLAASSAQGQVPAKVIVSVPFDFTAGKATLKAGKYNIKRSGGAALSIRSLDGTSTALVSAPLTLSSQIAKGGERLVFNRYGDQYFLSQVWLSVDTGRQVYPSEQEKKTAHRFELANHAKPERVEILIRGNE